MQRYPKKILILGGLLITFAVVGCCKKQQARIVELEKAVSFAEGSKKETEAERDQLLADVDKLNADKEALGADIEKLAAEKKEVEDQLNACNETIKAVEYQKEQIAELKKRQAKAQKRLATFKKMLTKFKKFIQTGKLNVTIKNGKMVLELPSAVLFELGKADLSADGKKTLATVASVLRTIKGREFQVAGHTDSIRLTDENPFKSNWELSTARAVKVVQFLENKGVASKNLSAAGYSQFQPAATNKTEAGQAKNRRIEITLMPDMEELPNLSDLQNILKKK